MFEYTPGRFVNVSRILTAHIYTKDNTIRVAIELDADAKEKSTIYTAPFPDIVAAQNFCKTMPVLVAAN